MFRVTRVSPLTRAIAGDLFVERAARVGDSEAAPDLRSIGVEVEYSFAERTHNGRQPSFKSLRLFSVTTSTNELDAAAQLADRNGG